MDGCKNGLNREKLVNEFNSNSEVFLFLISTRTGKLGFLLFMQRSIPSIFWRILSCLVKIEFLSFFSLGRRDERWTENKSYFRMDGCKNGLNREKLVNEFNSNSEVFLFLISTRTGNLGVNLIGTNRVVVFDASWNHRHDQKTACRVNRKTFKAYR